MSVQATFAASHMLLGSLWGALPLLLDGLLRTINTYYSYNYYYHYYDDDDVWPGTAASVAGWRSAPSGPRGAWGPGLAKPAKRGSGLGFGVQGLGFRV